eukprot:1145109-Pelagomonas_calceolata.AAC.1
MLTACSKTRKDLILAWQQVGCLGMRKGKHCCLLISSGRGPSLLINQSCSFISFSALEAQQERSGRSLLHAYGCDTLEQALTFNVATIFPMANLDVNPTHDSMAYSCMLLTSLPPQPIDDSQPAAMLNLPPSYEAMTILYTRLHGRQAGTRPLQT